MAKAPVAGRVKTRLAVDVGALVAADLAAAALLDTLDVIDQAFPDGVRSLALAGDLTGAERSEELVERLDGWIVVAQRGGSFAERIGNAHGDVHDVTGSAVVQIGMDTPHVMPEMLLVAAEALADCDGILGPAEDGGWWLLGLTEPRQALLLRDVPMSRPDTGDLTMAALTPSVLMRTGSTTYDVDVAIEAERAATDAPNTRFSAAWRALERSPE
ncbi:MAG: DUF2064 domain-containing protein [Actinomycetota bacterium]|nr:DUF2064 domain-containing protein [Actinomycetota bacterium]